MFKYENIKKIHVELSSMCNASCPNCPRNVDGGYEVPWINTATFTIDDFKKLFDPEMISKLDFVTICGNFGDPVMCEDLPLIIKYIHECNPWVSTWTHTNGGLRSAEWWASIAEVQGPHDLMIFSIDGLEDTNHIYRRNVRWDRVMANAKAFIEAGGNALWEYLIFAHNEHQVDEAREFSKQLGFKEFRSKRAFGFDFLGSNRPQMRVLNRDGSFAYFIDEPSDETKHNKNVVVDNVVTDTDHSMTKTDYKNVFDHMQNHVRNGHFDFSNLDGFQIDCSAAHKKEIYVDANFGVHPCCYLGHASNNITLSPDQIQYYKWIEDNVGFENINAMKTSIKDVIESGYFDKIVKTWDKTHAEGRIATCSRMCPARNRPSEKLYVE